jgi:hypothetical protein
MSVEVPMPSHPALRLGLVVLCWAVATLAIDAQAGHAAIVTLDFEDLRTVDANPSHFVGQVYIHDGVRLRALPAPPPADPTTFFLYAGTLSTSFAGSTMLRLGADTTEIVVDLVNGGRFNLRSLDLAETPNFDITGKPIGFGTFNVTFTGERANGTEISETVTVDRFPTIDTYTFPGFANLTSVHWFQGPGGFLPGFGDHQFDNVSLLIIPEPATLWLLALGALLLLILPRVNRRGSHRVHRSSPRYRASLRTRPESSA